MKRAARIFSIFIFLLGCKASAQLQLQENFSSNTYEDSSNTTAVWNNALHYIHSPLAVSLTDGANNEDSLDANVGNGQDGLFDVSTYQNFSVGGNTSGNIITIDTDAHPVLQFTSFNLASGWQIEGTGANPLWIKVLGAVNIAGTIDCSGGGGASVSTNLVVAPQGGAGRCGGGNGGAGGTSLSAAQGGTSGGTAITGGSGGSAAATGAGGGGGGGYTSNSFSGSNGYVGGLTTGGAVGTSFADPTFTYFASNGVGGGSGGGGGGYSTGTYSGGGGGAGGGVIRFTAVGNITIAATGAVLARAGSGGGGVAGGGGGGGAGGGIWLQTPGVITNNGTIDASSPTSLANGGVASNNGGYGTNGRTWLTSSVDPIVGNPENPQSELFGTGPCFCAGEIHYSIASYQAQTQPYDLQNTSPTPGLLTLVNSLPNTSTATILVAGSNDKFVTDDTGFVSISQLSLLNTKRYVRFQVTLQLNPSGFASTPATINSVTLNYSGYEQNQFNLNSTCGTLGGPGEFFNLIGLFLFLFWFTSGRLRRQVLHLRRSFLA